MIELTRAPDADEAGGILGERCCFCRRQTQYWFEPKDVAVCRGCAAHAEPKDVPSKKVWLRREDIATASRRPPKPKFQRGRDDVARPVDESA